MARALRQGTGLISDYAKSGTRSQTDSGRDMVGMNTQVRKGSHLPCIWEVGYGSRQRAGLEI
jgi:hypothetical protein